MRTFVFPTTFLAFALLGTFEQPARAADAPQGLRFNHQDWELVCDNTRTCRAAGYHSDGDGSSREPLPVSVLLTRKAGPGTPVVAELQVGAPGDQTLQDWLGEDTLTMRIDGKPVGTVAVGSSTGILPLSARQAAALIGAVGGSGRVDWKSGKRTWTLSGSGATAVLLKMDDFQGRLDTPGQAAPVPAQDHVALPESALRALRAELAAGLKDCPRSESDEPAPELDVRRLSAAKLLVSTSCWIAAYNTGDAYWVVNAGAPYAPVLVTQDGTYYEQGKLSADQKGRGIGDCGSHQEWTWDGRRFVATEQVTSGQCKSIAPGGAWSLPTLVTTRRPAR